MASHSLILEILFFHVLFCVDLLAICRIRVIEDKVIPELCQLVISFYSTTQAIQR